MSARRTPAATPGHTTWGAVDWSRAPVARTGTMGLCVHCRRPAFMRHPLTGQPCHKTCDDEYAAKIIGQGGFDAGTSGGL